MSVEGGLSARGRARRQMLKDYEKPPMDGAVDKALLAFMAIRRAEIGEGG